MHIPDGMLSPTTCVVAGAVMLPVWGTAARRARTALNRRQVPLLAALAAFSFTIMMFNVPVVGGTTAHAVGGTLLAIALGPWAAVIGVTVALAIQALLFADGGLLTFGANALAMAFVGPFVGFAAYRLLAGDSPSESKRRAMAAGLGAYLGLNASALVVALLLGIQPHLFRGSDGRPLYFPLDFAATLPGMLLPHLLVAGVVEGIVTAAGVRYLAGAYRSLLEAQAAPAAAPGRLYWLLVAAIIATPLGLLAPGSAWGEWAKEDVRKMLGYTPAGLAKLSNYWKTPLADYQLGAGGSFLHSAMGYWLSATVGVGLILTVMLLLGRGLAARRMGADSLEGGEA